MTARDDLTSEMARRPWSGCPTVWERIKCLYEWSVGFVQTFREEGESEEFAYRTHSVHPQ